MRPQPLSVLRALACAAALCALAFPAFARLALMYGFAADERADLARLTDLAPGTEVPHVAPWRHAVDARPPRPTR